MPWCGALCSLQTTAARHFIHALEPSNQNLLGNAALLLEQLGRLDEAVALDEYVAARDPVNPIGHFNLGLKYRYVGRLDDAINSFDIALSLSPEYLGAEYHRALALLRKGEPRLALEGFRRERDEEYRVKGTALALYELDRLSEFEKAFSELRERWGEQWGAEIAHVYAWIGDPDETFTYLENVYEDGSPMAQLSSDDLFANIHDDPRWPPFLEKIGQAPKQLEAIEFMVTLPK